MVYHTALAQGAYLKGLEPIEGMHPAKGGIAGTWDIMQGEIPKEFDDIDLVYTEPAWSAGLDVFMERAGRPKLDFSDYCERVMHIIDELGKPTVMIWSKSAQKYGRTPDHLLDVRLNNHRAPVAFFNGAKPPAPSFSDNLTLIASLAQQFDNVGDFSAGYGNTARIFRGWGKRFVMTDVNPLCADYIIKNSGGW